MTYGNPYIRDIANPQVELFAGDFPVKSQSGIYASGQDVKMGWILGRVTATQELKLCVKAAVDGSQVPIAIAADDYDATIATCKGETYLTGDFSQTALAYGAGWTWPELKAALRPLSIFITPVIAN